MGCGTRKTGTGFRGLLIPRGWPPSGSQSTSLRPPWDTPPVGRNVDSICVGCGMCCDGTMYRTVDVGGDDRLELLESAGLIFSTEGGVTSFRQPCLSHFAPSAIGASASRGTMNEFIYRSKNI